MLERFKTLRAKFLFVLLIPVVIATVIVTAVFGFLSFIDLKNDVLAKKESIAALNAELLKAPMWNFDRSNVERIAASIGADADVASVIVRNDQGEIIARVGEPKRELVVQQDIVHTGLKKTYVLGRLEITFHMQRIHGAITRQIVQYSLLLLSLVVVILVVAVFANRWIVDRPLDRLLSAIRLAEEHGSRGPVEWQSEDEIGAVIAAFNAMQEKLGAEERNLRISEARLVDAQRIAKLGNWTWDIANDNLWWSDETCRIFGRESEDPGATWGAFLETVHPEDRGDVEEAMRKALAREAPYLLDYRIVLPDGGERFVHGEGEVAFDGAGKPVNMLGTVQDITERRYAEQAKRESEERLRAVMDNAPAIVHLKDNEGRFRIVNKGFEQFYGMPADAALGKTATDLFPEALADTYSSLDQSVRETGEVITREIETMRHDGALRIIRSIRFPVFGQDGRTTGVGVVALDVTERRRAHEDLARAKVAAEAANRVKSEFLSSMSHELRTPLNAVLGFGQMLELNPKEPLTKTQKSYVDHILRGGQYLLELINEVLDLAKIEAGEAELYIEDVWAKTVLDECFSLIHPMADERGIEIIVGEGFKAATVVRADQTRFKQALLNLMSNAVKYNRENGKVTVDCHETPGGRLHISVTDTGEGIPGDALEDLFEPFCRLRAEETEIEGAGIGLTITKKLVENMDGQIGVDTEVGEGSTFWIELPLTERRFLDEADFDQEEVKDEATSIPEVCGTVLYVEDNPANLRLMEQIMERVAGLSMIPAHRAELGIELAKINSPDLIILDINLPGMDGFEAMRALRSIKETRDIPVIALSANAMPEDIEKGIKAGFKQYLTKPVRVEEVVNAVKEVLDS